MLFIIPVCICNIKNHTTLLSVFLPFVTSIGKGHPSRQYSFLNGISNSSACAPLYIIGQRYLNLKEFGQYKKRKSLQLYWKLENTQVLCKPLFKI